MALPVAEQAIKRQEMHVGKRNLSSGLAAISGFDWRSAAANAWIEKR